MANMAVFPHPLDALLMFVLQVAPVEGPWRSCEGSAISPASLLPTQRFFSLAFSPSLCVFNVPSIFFFFFFLC